MFISPTATPITPMNSLLIDLVIKLKNIKIVNGKPLFYYVVQASLSVGIKTVVSTEDKEIRKLGLI